MMTQKKHFKTLYDFLEVFSTEEKCTQHLKELRWKNGEFCPYCGNKKLYNFKDKKTYKCSECRKRFSIKVGTIFEDSNINLKKWFLAIFFATNHKKGISSLQLSKDIGVTQKTAWFMLHRIREATIGFSKKRPLFKEDVQADETYIGGKESNKHNSKKIKNSQGRSKTKSIAFGLIEKGKVKVSKVKNVSSNTLFKQITKNVSIGANLTTDDFKSYRPLNSFYNHNVIAHSKRIYVIDGRHTNGIENFWGIVKRNIYGIYHVVGSKYLDRYLKEFAFRYNTREEDFTQRFNNLLSNTNNKISHKQLVTTI
jgi:transposase-like protein